MCTPFLRSGEDFRENEAFCLAPENKSEFQTSREEGIGFPGEGSIMTMMTSMRVGCR